MLCSLCPLVPVGRVAHGLLALSLVGTLKLYGHLREFLLDSLLARRPQLGAKLALTLQAEDDGHRFRQGAFCWGSGHDYFFLGKG